MSNYGAGLPIWNFFVCVPTISAYIMAESETAP